MICIFNSLGEILIICNFGELLLYYVIYIIFIIFILLLKIGKLMKTIYLQIKLNMKNSL